MVTHKARKGDCIASIAAEYGFADWRAVWNHPANAGLRAKRLSPNVLREGDDVVLPTLRTATATMPTGKQHRFILRVPRVHLRLVLQDRRGRALASQRFELDAAGETLSGTTDGSGLLDARISSSAKEAELLVFLEGDRVMTIPLAVGHLEPDDSQGGLQQRLHNLAYLPGPEPDEEELASALREFQRDNGLGSSGTADEATRQKLRHHHKT